MEINISDPYYAEKTKALAALYTVIDPELMINIVDMGLVYELDFSHEGKIIVIMTLSTSNCPLEEAIVNGVKNALAVDFPTIPVDVNIVWEPEWNFTMLSENAREELGFDE